MESNGNPVLALLGFWMTMQLVATLALLLGGIYALYCLGRAASGMDRLASAVEELVKRQTPATGSTPAAPSAGVFGDYRNVPTPPPAQPFTAPVEVLPAPPLNQ